MAIFAKSGRLATASMGSAHTRHVKMIGSHTSTLEQIFIHIKSSTSAIIGYIWINQGFSFSLWNIIKMQFLAALIQWHVVLKLSPNEWCSLTPLLLSHKNRAPLNQDKWHWNNSKPIESAMSIVSTLSFQQTRFSDDGSSARVSHVNLHKPYMTGCNPAPQLADDGHGVCDGQDSLNMQEAPG